MKLTDKNILLYDGHCLMCSGLVHWVMNRDRKGIVYFGALQDESTEPLMKKAPAHIRNADSVVLYTGGRFYFRSAAILKLYQLLGYPWKLMSVFFIVPRFIRDAVYRLIARYRKRWFGQSDSCFLVPPDKRARFLSE